MRGSLGFICPVGVTHETEKRLATLSPEKLAKIDEARVIIANAVMACGAAGMCPESVEYALLIEGEVLGFARLIAERFPPQPAPGGRG